MSVIKNAIEIPSESECVTCRSMVRASVGEGRGPCRLDGRRTVVLERGGGSNLTKRVGPTRRRSRMESLAVEKLARRVALEVEIATKA